MATALFWKELLSLTTPQDHVKSLSFHYYHHLNHGWLDQVDTWFKAKQFNDFPQSNQSFSYVKI